jgi:hypothetical protein
MEATKSCTLVMKREIGTTNLQNEDLLGGVFHNDNIKWCPRKPISFLTLTFYYLFCLHINEQRFGYTQSSFSSFFHVHMVVSVNMCI